MKKQNIIIAALFFLVAGFGIEASAQSRVTIKKGETNATIKGTIGKFATKDYVFTYGGGHIARMTITSRNDCVKFGGGETEMNLGTQEGDNYIDLRNQCGLDLAFTITIHIE